jgi:hypothetical protein
MLGAVVNKVDDEAKSNLVFFNVHIGRNDITFYQTYAKESGRQFVLIDLTRSGVAGLAERHYRFEGGIHIDNPEGRPQEAANELLKLATQ